MSIAIMACRKVIGKCAASGCFKAYNNSTAAFSIYGELVFMEKIKKI